MSKTPTAAQKRRHDLIADYGCIVCRMPANIHHVRAGQGMSQRNHDKVLPLCHLHHQGAEGYHKNRVDFETENGSELELMEIIDQLFPINEGNK